MKFLITIFFIAQVCVLFSQDIKGKIDSLKIEIDERIILATEAFDGENIFPHMDMTCRLTQRAVGTVNSTVRVYFDRHDNLIWSEEEQIEKPSYQATLRKAEMAVVSGSYILNFSFYFDEIGDLRAYIIELIDHDYGCSIEQYYFHNQKLLLFEKSVIDCDSKAVNSKTTKKDLTLDEHMYGQELLVEANRFTMLLEINYRLFMKY